MSLSLGLNSVLFIFIQQNKLPNFCFLVVLKFSAKIVSDNEITSFQKCQRLISMKRKNDTSGLRIILCLSQTFLIFW